MIDRVVKARPMSLGGVPVGRVLPVAPMRSLGPFVFLDHMGPHTFLPGTGFDVAPHPHIGLATLTYLYEGEVVHRDSTGATSTIRPGDVNLMSAGRGVAHSERSPDAARRAGGSLHGLQFWLALAEADEDSDPRFEHADRAALPMLDRAGIERRVVVGAHDGATSPIGFSSRAMLIDVAVDADASTTMTFDEAEVGVYVAEGSVTLDGESLDARTLARIRPGAVRIEARERSRLAILGGAPLEHPRRMWWNFVASDDSRIERAKRAWRNREFPRVPGDEVEFIPLPET